MEEGRGSHMGMIMSSTESKRAPMGTFSPDVVSFCFCCAIKRTKVFPRLLCQKRQLFECLILTIFYPNFF